MLQSLDTLIAFVLIMLVVSLLITIVVQMISAALNLRGWNMRMGLAQTFEVIVPSMGAQQAKELAQHVLKSGLISDSAMPKWIKVWRSASAVRPAEVFDALHRFATGRQEKSETQLREASQNLLAALGADRELLVSAATVMNNAKAAVAEDLTKAIEKIPDKALRQKIEAGVGHLGNRLNALATEEVNALAKDGDAIDKAYGKFQYWYGIAQERVQQWFTTHTRFITVLCAIVFAFWLQLDTVEIFHLVSTDRTLRDQLVAQSGVIGSQAEKVLAGSASVLQRGYAAWLAKLPPDAQATLAPIQVQPNDTREELLRRIDAALAAGPGKAQQLQALNDTLDNTATETLKQRAGDYSAVKSDFDHSSFDLFPTGTGGRWGHGWRRGWADHWVGLLFSVGLLSLGAPFWYNSLKGLASLRSTVAQNISDEKDQDQAVASDAGIASFIGPRYVARGPVAPPTVK